MSNAVNTLLESLKINSRVDSRLISPIVDFRHRVILEHIDRYRNHLDELGAVEFKIGKQETAGGPQVQRYALLNEDHCYFILLLMRNNPKASLAKLAFIKAFRLSRMVPPPAH